MTFGPEQKLKKEPKPVNDKMNKSYNVKNNSGNLARNVSGRNNSGNFGRNKTGKENSGQYAGNVTGQSNPGNFARNKTGQDNSGNTDRIRSGKSHGPDFQPITQDSKSTFGKDLKTKNQSTRCQFKTFYKCNLQHCKISCCK